MKPIALITGITGQDGSYLAELLLSLGYRVHGLIRRSSSINTGRIDHLYTDPHEGGKLTLHYGDMTDAGSLTRLVDEVMPSEVYNLAAQSHVRVSFDQPEYTAQCVAVGTLNLLEAIRTVNTGIRFYQASSSEMFGSTPPPQNELTPFHPRSPYACAKVMAYWQTVNYREAYGIHASNGILFNHESLRRGETFVTRKVTRAVGRIVCGLQDTLYLGNLDASRDWGFAGDFVRAMQMMLQQSEPGDYVVATGESHTVRELCEIAFGAVGLDWQEWVEIDERYKRPAEVDALEGDASKARAVLGWQPEVGFKELIGLMVQHDLSLAREEKCLEDHRKAVLQ